MNHAVFSGQLFFGNASYSEHGLWVKHSAYEALAARLAEAERLLRPLIEHDPEVRQFFGLPAFTRVTDSAAGETINE